MGHPDLVHCDCFRPHITETSGLPVKHCLILVCAFLPLLHSPCSLCARRQRRPRNGRTRTRKWKNRLPVWEVGENDHTACCNSIHCRLLMLFIVLVIITSAERVQMADAVRDNADAMETAMEEDVSSSRLP